MNYMHLRISIFLLFCTVSFSKISGQGEIDQDKILLLGKEHSASFSLYSNGWGMDYRYGKRINYTVRNIFDAGFAYLKNPKEDNTPAYQEGPRLVFGKTNLFVSFNGGYGYQKEIFSKVDKGGISIKIYSLIGATIVLYKPIYYIVQNPVTLQDETRKFDTDLTQKSEIIDKAKFYIGLSETRFLPGAYTKSGFQFEFSRKKNIINAIECGVTTELFPKKVPIMALDKNNRYYFLELFISYRFGRISNPLIHMRNEEIKKYLEENSITK